MPVFFFYRGLDILTLKFFYQATEILSRLYAAHHEGKKYAGLDIEVNITRIYIVVLLLLGSSRQRPDFR